MGPNDFRLLLDSALKETGASLEQSTAEVAQYAAERTAYLSTLVGQPGFELAVQAERDAVALFAGIVAVGQAQAVQGRIIGVIQGALFMGAKALAG
jgi:hypothetical protein